MKLQKMGNIEEVPTHSALLKQIAGGSKSDYDSQPKTNKPDSNQPSSSPQEITNCTDSLLAINGGADAAGAEPRIRKSLIDNN